MNSALFPDLVVNGEAVPHTVVAAETQNHDAPAGKPGLAWRKAANAVAIRTLLLQEAKARNLRPVCQEVSPGRFETDEEALIRGLLDTVVHVEAPDEDAVRAEWEKDPTRFRAPPLWEVSHILCACDPRDVDATQIARDRARALTELALANGTDFAALATQESDCASKASGGALGQLGPGDTVPEFEAVLRGMRAGEVTSAPILTRHGWHIVRMDAVAMGAVLPFETVRQKITDAMEKAAWASQARSFVDSLVASAEIAGADLRPI
ncbi:peptidylprolyl isomerase [Litoreibacter roseus]|uniref:Parvulin-like PPIase n=1 Tax=Litoreibacter roseus TaxID=2601869 RepID=A0A6N6JAQ4_9RHOB|nr:peptidylprolyl isomerase [Litoreibacter roseus]GFE63265.1 peptidylprolyl isomerase [Litoreibacter roseus]